MPSKKAAVSGSSKKKGQLAGLSAENVYGLKGIDTPSGPASALDGPGLPANAKGGVSTSGSHWPGRLRGLCGQMTEEFGEDEIYATWAKGERLYHTYCKAYCEGQWEPAYLSAEEKELVKNADPNDEKCGLGKRDMGLGPSATVTEDEKEDKKQEKKKEL